MFDSIVEEYRAEFARGIKAQATFFKHAQRDPDAVADFDPALNETLMLITVNGLGRMQEPFEALELTLIAWFQLHEPRFFVHNVFARHVPVELLNGFRQVLPKKEFFEICQLAFRQPNERD